MNAQVARNAAIGKSDDDGSTKARRVVTVVSLGLHARLELNQPEGELLDRKGFVFSISHWPLKFLQQLALENAVENVGGTT